jgi:hypothetical protein
MADTLERSRVLLTKSHTASAPAALKSAAKPVTKARTAMHESSAALRKMREEHGDVIREHNKLEKQVWARRVIFRRAQRRLGLYVGPGGLLPLLIPKGEADAEMEIGRIH